MAKPKDKIKEKLAEVIYDLIEIDKDINAYELFITDAEIIKDIKNAISILEEVERKIAYVPKKIRAQRPKRKGCIG